MANLDVITEQIQKEIKVDPSGKGSASIRATARLSGINDMALRKSLASAPNLYPIDTKGEGADLTASKLATKLMEQGFSGADLTRWGTTGIPDIAVAIILEYYAFDAGRYTTEQAKLAYRAFASIGVRVWFQKLAGWVSQPVNQTAPLQLPPPHIQVTNLVSSLKDLGIELDNPRYSQQLKDLTLNILGVASPALPSASLAEWTGVAERAEELGYPVLLVAAKRSQLGKYIKAQGILARQEKRLVNGTQRPVNIYEVTPELDRAIQQFFS